MTAKEKASSLVQKYGNAVAIILADHTIELAEAIVEKGWKGFGKMVAFWEDVREEIIKMG